LTLLDLNVEQSSLMLALVSFHGVEAYDKAVEQVSNQWRLMTQCND